MRARGCLEQFKFEGDALSSYVGGGGWLVLGGTSRARWIAERGGGRRRWVAGSYRVIHTRSVVWLGAQKPWEATEEETRKKIENGLELLREGEIHCQVMEDELELARGETDDPLYLARLAVASSFKAAYSGVNQYLEGLLDGTLAPLTDMPPKMRLKWDSCFDRALALHTWCPGNLIDEPDLLEQLQLLLKLQEKQSSREVLVKAAGRSCAS
mmetsp:Transcript_53251/g.124777  ORF Transcript_53251/g.124777 Transcript_53251/m.124777 type:complete len:212 (-) Transcript_53251:900-1535(-)